jgi:hypothetical protein
VLRRLCWGREEESMWGGYAVRDAYNAAGEREGEEVNNSFSFPVFSLGDL